jgi:hypothetical protein
MMFSEGACPVTPPQHVDVRPVKIKLTGTGAICLVFAVWIDCSENAENWKSNRLDFRFCEAIQERRVDECYILFRICAFRSSEWVADGPRYRMV